MLSIPWGRLRSKRRGYLLASDLNYSGLKMEICLSAAITYLMVLKLEVSFAFRVEENY